MELPACRSFLGAKFGAFLHEFDLNLFGNTSREENAPTSGAILTNTRIFCTAGSAVQGSICTAENNFMCGGYQRRTTDCTSHYIRESVLDRIVPENLKEMTAYARKNADEFYEMAAQNGRAEARKFSKSAKQKRKQIETRIARIDNTIRCLYENRVVGRITPEHYDQLAAGYESEQTELREKLAKKAGLDLQERYIRKFIEQAGVH